MPLLSEKEQMAFPPAAQPSFMHPLLNPRPQSPPPEDPPSPVLFSNYKRKAAPVNPASPELSFAPKIPRNIPLSLVSSSPP